MPQMLIRYNKPNVHHVGDTALMPGVNQVDSDAFESWKKLKAFAALLVKQPGERSPVIELVDAPAAAKTEEIVDLSKMSAKDANAIIEETLDTALLKKWLEVEKRKGVKETLEAQLELAGPTKPPVTTGDDDTEDTQ